MGLKLNFFALVFILLFAPSLFCSDDLCGKIDKQVIDDANSSINKIIIEINENVDFDEYLLNLEKFANIQADIGNAQFLRKGDWAFPIKKVTRSGTLNKGLFTGSSNGEKWFIKKIGSDSPATLTEFLNAEKLYGMGLAPKLNLVRIKENYFLVTKEIAGINVKDILTAEKSNKEFIKNINALLNIKAKTVAEAKRAYAIAILNDEKIMAGLKEMAKRLNDYQFYNPNDLQIMIAPTQVMGGPTLSIIDTANFRKISKIEHEQNIGPIQQIEKMIQDLRNLAK